MGFRDLPFRNDVLKVSANRTITWREIQVYYGHILADTGGITLTLPQPAEDYAKRYVCFFLSNHGASSITVACTDGFAQSGDSITVAAGKTVLLMCIKTAPSVYVWAVIGA